MFQINTLVTLLANDIELNGLHLLEFCMKINGRLNDKDTQ